MTASRSNAVIAGLSLVIIVSCREPGATTRASARSHDAPALPDRDPALAHRLVEDEGALLLDVRTDQEFAQVHLPGAHHISHDQLDERIDEIEHLTKGERDAPIVVYCRSGRRSGLAKAILMDHGYTRVTNLGAISDW